MMENLANIVWRGMELWPGGVLALGLGAEEVARTDREVEYARLSGRDPQEARKRFERASANFAAGIERARRGAKEMTPPPAVVLDLLAALLKDARPKGDREKWLRS